MRNFDIAYNILAVDDNPINLRLLIDILSKQGYKIRSASDGHRALESAQSEPPDLILLDIKMPEMSGFETCERLKADERTRQIPVIFVSALNEVADKVQGFAVGGVDYITKPFQAEEVVERVRLHLTLQALQKNLKDEIRRRREAEDELRESNRQLQHANASKDLLFSIIGHDLRNPFTVLINMVEALIADLEDFSREALLNKLNMVLTTSKNIYALVNDLLAWSQSQRGVMEYEPVPLPLDEIVQHQLYSFNAAAAEKHIRLIHAIPPDLMVHADYHMVTTVLRNLLSNAVKFTDAQGTITITAEPQEEMLAVTVADTGIGMSQEFLARLFNIQYKTSRPGTRDEPGTGLGLILCKEFIEKHGGELAIDSQEAQGTTCRFTLPLGKRPCQ